MSTKKNADKATKNDEPKVSRKDAAAIAANKPANVDPENPTPDSKEKSAKSPKPTKSPGTPIFCRNSLRPSELFEPEDVVFFREGPAGELKPIPRHEADVRFAEIEKSDSSEFDKNKGVGTTVLDLKGGDKVTITGDKIIVTPKEGPASTEGPSLNVHHADTQG